MISTYIDMAHTVCVCVCVCVCVFVSHTHRHVTDMISTYIDMAHNTNTHTQTCYRYDFNLH